MTSYRTLLLAPSLCLAALVPLGGCGSSGAATGGMGGAEGVGGAAGSPPDDNLLDRQTLQACTDESNCRKALAQVIEGGERFTINDAECLLIALRDRTEGRYEIDLDHTFTSGSFTDQHLLVITPTGLVERSVALRSVDECEGITETTYAPTERCAPKPVSFFSACLEEFAATDPDDRAHTDGAWACVLPGLERGRPVDLPWFEDCRVQPPSCD